MYLQFMILRNFRNYTVKEIEFHPILNVITGLNAQGKSNLLEAVSYLSMAASFRGAKDQDLVRWGQQYFYLEGMVKKNSGDYTVSIGYSLNNRKVVKVNGSQRRKISDLLGVLNSVIFSPEDLLIVKSGPAARRKYLDGEMSQMFPSYFYTLWQYQKILTQRNNVLREIRDQNSKKDLLDIWDVQLVDIGSKIIKKRLEVLKKLAPLARLIHRKITEGEEELDISYESLGDGEQVRKASLEGIKDFFNLKLMQSQTADINRGVTLIGPHRDDLKLVINNTDVRKFGSQGQQRTTALSLKMAELELVKGETAEYPVLLLDDVLSELDEKRRRHLLDLIGGRVQTFITATGTDFILPAGKKIEVYQGNFRVEG